MSDSSVSRPQISLREGVILHNGGRAPVVLRRDMISVGWSDISPEAMEFILARWRAAYGPPPVTPQEVVVQ